MFQFSDEIHFKNWLLKKSLSVNKYEQSAMDNEPSFSASTTDDDYVIKHSLNTNYLTMDKMICFSI